MKYWLMKSEPGAYSIDDLARDGVTPWDGVRNYQARNFMRTMKKGDQVLFYHSNAKPSGIAGMAEIVREHYPDPTALDPADDHYDPGSTAENNRWSLVDVGFRKKAKRIIPLKEIKAMPELLEMILVRSSRLSVQPVTPREWEIIAAVRDAW